MFSSEPNASKLALLCLAELMKVSDTAMIDCQLPNPYLMSMGAQLVSRDVYLQKLANAKQKSLAKQVFSPRFIEWRSKILAD